MPHRHPPLSLVLMLAALAGASSPAAAQTVVGQVVTADTEVPMPGVFLTLIDSSGERAAGFLSREDGTFLIRAPGPGTYQLNVEMIGYRSLSETLRLDAGEALRRTLRMPLQAIELEEIVARAPRERQCRLRPEEGDALSRVWRAARQGLELAEWSEEAGWLRGSGHTYQRVLDLVDLEVLAQTVQRVASVEPNAFTAADPAVVRAEGFIRRTADGGTVYYGADAALLLSDDFLDTHCFRMDERPDEGLVGLAFEPVPNRTVPEIEGVLWLEGETARLHSLEYRYTDYRTAAPIPPSRFGGFTEFRHLPGGALAVERWRIRMPTLLNWADLVAMRGVRRCGSDPCDDGETLRQLGRAGLAIEEEGGAVLSYRLPDGTTLPAADQAAIVGTVVDSTVEGAPARLAAAEVYIVGTDYRTVSDDRGRFRFDNLAEGVYRLAFRHPKLIELGIEQPAAAVVEATAGAVATTVLALPAPATLALGRCGGMLEGGAAAADARVVHGMVRDAMTGAAIGGASVRLAASTGADSTFANARTDAAGRYLFCDAPDGPLRVEASYLGKGWQVQQVEPGAGASAKVDLQLALSNAGRLLGRVARVSDGAAVSGARVRIAESGQEAVTNDDGRFVFDSVAAGAVTVETEHIGYRPSSGSVTLRGGETVEVELRVADQVFQLDPIVITARSQPLLMEPRMSGFYIREARGLGTFLGPEDFANRTGARVTDFLREGTGLQVSKEVAGTLVQGRRPRSLGPNNDNPHCAPMIYLDGVRISTRTRELVDVLEATAMIDQIPASELAGIEVYAGASSVPGEFAGLNTDCGVVAVWTRSRDRTRQP